MRYHYTKETLFVRGDFKAVSTGVDGGMREVSTLLNSTVSKDFSNENPLEYIQDILSKKGYSNDAFGLLTAVNMTHLCVLRYDFVTVFVTAGVSNPNPDPTKPHTINIIAVSDEELSDAALLETIITVTEAKAHALRLLGRDFTGTTSDAVIVACKKSGNPHTYAGTATPVGERVYSAVLKGVVEAINRHEKTVLRDKPSFFIYSRYMNTGWFEWISSGCKYYPCHFEGQRCDFCYCPFYPCKDETLGEWIECSSESEPVWSCSNCTLLHSKKTAEYLIKHQDATFEELKNV